MVQLGICKHVGASVEESLGVTWGYVVICLNSQGFRVSKKQGSCIGSACKEARSINSKP